jgi:hypothetical protein
MVAKAHVHPITGGAFGIWQREVKQRLPQDVVKPGRPKRERDSGRAAQPLRHFRPRWDVCSRNLQNLPLPNPWIRLFRARLLSFSEFLEKSAFLSGWHLTKTMRRQGGTWTGGWIAISGHVVERK